VKIDTGYSKKGKVVVMYSESRLFFFQFESFLLLNKFLIILGYILKDGFPLYIHADGVKNFFLKFLDSQRGEIGGYKR